MWKPLVVLVATLGVASGLDAQPAGLSSCARTGVETLQKWYVEDTGQWTTTNWWNAANGVTMLVRYGRLTDSADLKTTIANTFARNSDKKFLNEYYDDEGWWALAWIDAYEWTHETKYLDMAEEIFADMAKGWDDTCNGGIWWKKDRRYKNAIANELFLSVGARLAATVKDPARKAEYLKWASKEWDWFAASGMINAKGLINDGLTAACQNNGRNTWTYNQGVVLGGLSALSADTGDKALLEKARSIAEAAIANLTDADGILHDRCEPKCGADGVQFKGIFSRNLATLNAVTHSPKFRSFLDTNAERICKVQTDDHKFGVVWSAASEEVNAATQISALDAIVAAMMAARR